MIDPERRPLGAKPLIAAALIATGSLALLKGGEDRILDKNAIAEHCEDADIKIYPVDGIGDEDQQLHAPIDERSYGTAVFKPEDDTSQKTAQRIMLGSGSIARIAFKEANPRLNPDKKVSEDEPVRVQISAFDSFTITDKADEDKDPKTKISIEKIAQDTGIDEDSIECLSGFNAEYEPKDGETYKVFVPRQITGDQVAGYQRVVLRRQDDIKAFAQKVESSKNVSVNGVRPIDFRAGTILYKKGSEAAPKASPNQKYESPTSDVKTFVDHYKADAAAVEKKYGVPKELVLAQGILESSYGESELAQKAFNFHGLKANDQWKGPVYTKVTREVVSPLRMHEFPNAKVIGSRDNGLVEIEIKADFKKFSSAAEGFMGYGDHLKNRGDSSGKFYNDAFTENDPQKFVKRLVDGVGKKYATDPDYVKKVSRVLKGVKSALTPSYEDVVPATPKAFESYPSGQQQFGKGEGDAPLGAPDDRAKSTHQIPNSNKDRFEYSLKSLEKVELSKDGYSNFKLQLEQNDLSDEVPKMYPRNFGDYPKPANPNDPKYFILHFTAYSPAALHYDGWKFASSMRNGGAGTGINYYINNKAVPYIMADNYVDHMYGYNGESYGVEISASEQAGITPEQYSAAIYNAAYFLLERKYITEGDDVASIVNRVVRGHGDMRVAADNHTDFPRPMVDAFNRKLTAFIKDELLG